MNPSPSITVLMAVHNGERYLEKSIESILWQTWSDFEFLIVDDASTDRTTEILRSFQARDQRIRVFSNEKNVGLTVSLNIGLAESKGRCVARHDADDISLPDRLSKQRRFLEDHPEYFLCATEFDYLDADDLVIARKPSSVLSSIQLAKKLEKKNYLAHPTIMFRNDGSRYREKFVYVQDYDFFLLALSAGKRLELLPDKLVQYRWTPSALSYRVRTKQQRFTEVARQFFRQRQECGRDDYDRFEPERILSLPDDSQSKTSLQSEFITFFLQNNQPDEARRIFALHREIFPPSSRFALNLFIRFPKLYSVYRKLRYGHDAAR